MSLRTDVDYKGGPRFGECDRCRRQSMLCNAVLKCPQARVAQAFICDGCLSNVKAVFANRDLDQAADMLGGWKEDDASAKQRIEDAFNRGYNEATQNNLAHMRRITAGMQQIGALLNLPLGSLVAEDAPAAIKKLQVEVRDLRSKLEGRP